MFANVQFGEHSATFRPRSEGRLPALGAFRCICDRLVNLAHKTLLCEAQADAPPLSHDCQNPLVFNLCRSHI